VDSGVRERRKFRGGGEEGGPKKREKKTVSLTTKKGEEKKTSYGSMKKKKKPFRKKKTFNKRTPCREGGAGHPWDGGGLKGGGKECPTKLCAGKEGGGK